MYVIKKRSLESSVKNSASPGMSLMNPSGSGSSVNSCVVLNQTRLIVLLSVARVQLVRHKTSSTCPNVGNNVEREPQPRDIQDQRCCTCLRIGKLGVILLDSAS